MEDHTKNSIVCPFCFQSFQDVEAVFRSNIFLTWDNVEKPGAPEGENRLREAFLRYEEYDSDLMLDFPQDQKIDQKLVQYWHKRGGPGGYQASDPKWYYPHIDPGEANFFQMTKEVEGSRFVYDPQGFAIKAHGVFGSSEGNVTRLCPHCHNPLPLQNYGKYPCTFIGVVGSTGSGKTVYLHQLLKNFEKLMEGSGYTAALSNFDALGEEVAMGRPLPAATDPALMRRPLAVNIVKDQTYYTLVLYDIAGEQCVRPKESFQTTDSLVAEFIRYSDGLLFLVDPTQLAGMGAPGEGEPVGIGQVMDRISELKTGTKKDLSTTPMAVVLTKCDKNPGSGSFGEFYEILRNKPYPSKPGFDRENYVGVSVAARKLFKEANADIYFKKFSIHNFFGISSINCGVQNRIQLHKSLYEINGENTKKLNLLRSFVRDWNRRTPEERLYQPTISGTLEEGKYLLAPVKDDKGEFLHFLREEGIGQGQEKKVLDIRSQSRELTPEDFLPQKKKPSAAANGGETVTEIRGDSLGAYQAHSIFLTVKEALEVELMGYPLGEPHPLRVEEPFFWLLWRMGLITAPAYHSLPKPEEPKFGLFGKKERYLADLAEWERVDEIRKQEFWDCKAPEDKI